MHHLVAFFAFLSPFVYVFLLLNAVALILFCYDKFAATRGKSRIPERTLHYLELLGGALLILPFMYIIRHKNRKWSYYLLTYLMAAGWLMLFLLFIYSYWQLT